MDWKGKKGKKMIWMMWEGHLAFHYISRGPRPSRVCKGRWGPATSSLCAAQSCKAYWIIWLLNATQLLHVRHHQKAESVPVQKGQLVVLDPMRDIKSVSVVGPSRGTLKGNFGALWFSLMCQLQWVVRYNFIVWGLSPLLMQTVRWEGTTCLLLSSSHNILKKRGARN